MKYLYKPSIINHDSIYIYCYLSMREISVCLIPFSLYKYLFVTSKYAICNEISLFKLNL